MSWRLITVMIKILTSSFSCIKQQLGSAAASPVIFVKFYIAKETILFAKEQWNIRILKPTFNCKRSRVLFCSRKRLMFSFTLSEWDLWACQKYIIQGIVYEETERTLSFRVFKVLLLASASNIATNATPESLLPICTNKYQNRTTLHKKEEL